MEVEFESTKPAVPPRANKELLKNGSSAVSKSVPVEQEMTRVKTASKVDPTRVLAAMTEQQLVELKTLDMEDLAAHFRHLGLRETPDLVIKNQLNGSILHTITETDVDKMGFQTLGEAKAFQNLCSRLTQIDRGEQRQEAVMVRKLVFWGDVHEWHSGPCDIFNCSDMKDKRIPCERCCDFVLCRPMQLEKLPESSLIVYRDHLTISSPIWIEDVVQKRYHELNTAFTNPNVANYKMVVDNIDYSNILDIDVEEVPPVKSFHHTCADCLRHCCCQSLGREPMGGNYYWVTPCMKCCGYSHRYKQRPDGVVTIRLRTNDGTGEAKRVGVLEGAKEVARTLLHFMEESQIRKGLRVS